MEISSLLLLFGSRSAPSLPLGAMRGVRCRRVIVGQRGRRCGVRILLLLAASSHNCKSVLCNIAKRMDHENPTCWAPNKTVPRTTIITIALLLLSFLFRFQDSICSPLSWKLQPLSTPLLSFSGNVVSYPSDHCIFVGRVRNKQCCYYYKNKATVSKQKNNYVEISVFLVSLCLSFSLRV